MEKEIKIPKRVRSGFNGIKDPNLKIPKMKEQQNSDIDKENITNVHQEKKQKPRLDAKLRNSRKKSLLSSISSSIISIETGLGINDNYKDFGRIADLDIPSFMNVISEVIRRADSGKKRDIKKQVGSAVISVNYISTVARISGVVLFKYKVIEGITSYFKTLHNITTPARHQKQNITELTSMMVTLERLEKQDTVEKAHSYILFRLLRLIFVLYIYDSKIHAAVLAEFVLSQAKGADVQNAKQGSSKEKTIC